MKLYQVTYQTLITGSIRTIYIMAYDPVHAVELCNHRPDCATVISAAPAPRWICIWRVALIAIAWTAAAWAIILLLAVLVLWLDNLINGY